jgi:very-short-patch-repair endonuclease
MTIPDFYIEIGNKKICIYADGHTYHERTEEQALRDRNIDRELQNLGFIVLRFTGKEIRERMENVIETIKKNI